MGIIKAIGSAIGGGLADQWLEVIEPNDMGDQTVFTSGVTVRQGDKRNSNVKGTTQTISNGSVIHVYPNQFMLLLDGGKVVDYTAEEGYYTVNNSSMPSLFNGQFGDTLKESFSRIKYSGTTPTKQEVFYVNLQEIKGIKFGTPSPINYFDNFYNAELFLRTHGTYSVKIVDPLLFYAEAIPRNRNKVEFTDINDQYSAEFLQALQAAINQMSADGIRISFASSKQRELGQYMSTTLDEEWRQMRGMIIQSVALTNISYDEESQKLINMRNQGAMLQDPTIREGYVQGSVARGMEAAGSNSAGAGMAFMGMGMGMQGGGNFMGAASASNQAQMQAQQQAAAAKEAAPEAKEETPASDGWTCECGAGGNAGNFCSTCGKPKPAPASDGWACECGAGGNTGNFCSTCGKPKPTAAPTSCPKCQYNLSDSGPAPKFCPNCGNQLG